MADRSSLFSSTRDVSPQNFDADLKRILGSFDNRPPLSQQTGLPTQNGISPELSGPITTGSPSNTGRGNRVKIPRFVTTEGGRRFGIQVENDEISTSTDVTDAALLADLMAAIKELGYVVLVTDALRVGAEASGIGVGRRSRHVRGQALDIGAVNGRRAALDHPDFPNNQDAIRLVQWFVQHGYQAGVESGADRAVLFGNHSFGWNRTGVPHHHHLHISIR